MCEGLEYSGSKSFYINVVKQIFSATLKKLKLHSPFELYTCVEAEGAGRQCVQAELAKHAFQLKVRFLQFRGDRAGIFQHSMGAKNRVGTGLSYRPAGYIGWRN